LNLKIKINPIAENLRMISILIPIFNFDVTDLVLELNNQAVAAQIEFE